MRWLPQEKEMYHIELISLLMSLEEPQGDVPSTLAFPIASQINALVIPSPARNPIGMALLILICFHPADDLSLQLLFILLHTDRSVNENQKLVGSFWAKDFQSTRQRMESKEEKKKSNKMAVINISKGDRYEGERSCLLNAVALIAGSCSPANVSGFGS